MSEAQYKHSLFEDLGLIHYTKTREEKKIEYVTRWSITLGIREVLIIMFGI